MAEYYAALDAHMASMYMFDCSATPKKRAQAPHMRAADSRTDEERNSFMHRLVTAIKKRGGTMGAVEEAKAKADPVFVSPPEKSKEVRVKQQDMI